MTTEQDSDRLERAGQKSELVSERLSLAANRIQDQLDHLLDIIGSDNFGSKLVNDAKGLKPQLEGSVKGTRSQAESWASLAAGQFKAAKVARENEEIRRQQLLGAVRPGTAQV
ncbi:hypothetical protein [Nocardia lijiangensis]|uniref:hypothetical protein n=1 Tax=Nocardia lijiangensis TaxID=299618 RepID=UPI003D759FD1